MSVVNKTLTTEENVILATKIRDLVETEPRTMEILAPLGLDLCCGGGHPLGEALELHGISQEDVLPQLVQLIQAPASPEQ